MVKFTIKMPDSWSKKKKEEMFDKPHQQKPDNSNLLKSIEDMLLVDDSKVWFCIPYKKWGNETTVMIMNTEIFKWV